MKRPKPLVLCILDGWGHAKPSPFNAITLAKTPTWDHWNNLYPTCFLDASGENVGLPVGQMGNSEVGHMTIGAGRVIFQDLPRISKSVASGDFFKNPLLLKLVEHLKKTKAACHVLGLLSPGGVHSHQDHLFAILDFLGSHHITVKLHAFLDGRDTPPASAVSYLKELYGHLHRHPSLQLVTVMGRYYAMDRDNRWDRTQKAVDAMVSAKTPRHFANEAELIDILQDFYKKGITDEFIPPLVEKNYAGVKEEDALFMTNFRADRVRQLLRALIEPSFTAFERSGFPKFSMKLAMTSYAKDLDSSMDVLFPPNQPTHTLGEVLSQAHLTQIRIAETEKYEHVTYFLNGGKETPFPQEERALIPSPPVTTYDLQPAMSAPEITEKVIQAIQSAKTDVIIINYANTDMVGHTGHLEPTIQAVEVVDNCLGKVATATLEAGGVLVITADHGNAEMMENPKTHEPHTSHTTNLVPFIVISNPPVALKSHGMLADVAPTLLTLLHLPIPPEMTGQSLIE